MLTAPAAVEGDGGAWGMARLVLFLVLFAVVVFVLFALVVIIVGSHLALHPAPAAVVNAEGEGLEALVNGFLPLIGHGLVPFPRFYDYTTRLHRITIRCSSFWC